MLSRTADHLFWLARYTERAENTARMLNVHRETALVPHSTAGSERGWTGVLLMNELLPAYVARHGEVTPGGVLQFMALDEDNPSSIFACLRLARENARAVRGAISSELWETINQTWLELNRRRRSGSFAPDPGRFLEWVKFRAHLARGVMLGTLLRDEALRFLGLGTFLERADNTARLLDVRFQAVENDVFDTAGDDGQEEAEYDFYHWTAILRSVSGFEVYRKVYRDVITPTRVAELLVLRADMPRSLQHCMAQVERDLLALGADPEGEARRQAGSLGAELRYARIEEILAGGLHAFLTGFLERVARLGVLISREFMLPPQA
jgi:uncharacterized alpha-E superfamily protein